MRPSSQSSAVPSSLPPWVAALAFMLALMVVPSSWAASKFKVLYAFQGTPDGAAPSGGLTLDANGNLYGTTANGGGTQTNCGYGYTGCGTVFKLTHGTGGWSESVLYIFCTDSKCTDGATPDGSMIFDAKGNLYGTTQNGGTYGQGGCSNLGLGCGTAFELSPNSGGWTESVLYSFQGSAGAGDPNGGLIFDSAGNLYGTNYASGNCCRLVFGWGAGAVFQLSPGTGQWSEDVLHDFCSQTLCGDGNASMAGLIWGEDGTLYGTTAYGGSSSFPCEGLGCGTVFQLVQSGGKWKEKLLHTFTGRDGAQPGEIVPDGKGNLYGTTMADGAFRFGTVFKLTPSGGRWHFQVVYNFRTGSFSGSFATRPAFDKSGNLYGTIWTQGSGNCQGGGCGLVYKLTPEAHGRWKYSVVHNFSGSDGGFPNTDLLFDKRGNLYGATEIGGSAEDGVVFEITP